MGLNEIKQFDANSLTQETLKILKSRKIQSD